ncbi:MAG: aldo/keto reductase [Spirochaetaceae bacterium]|jgi:aryl-alcohol dehydrogenase-like predicted oxidoreductase|nr:aldo/keto reductase [Spirochaetaceae bacterium]
MEYVQFGKTGVPVSRLGFGGAGIGVKHYIHPYDPDTEDSKLSAHKALETALELGITYFDTAPAYGNGASETIFGDVLGGADPMKIFLSTKCIPTDYDGLMRSVEGSLKRLRRSYVDLLQIHGGTYTDDRARQILAPHGMAEAMETLKRDGLVRFTGFTSEDNNRALYDFLDFGHFDAAQLCYNFLFQHPWEPNRPFGSLLEVEKHGLGIAAMRSAGSGAFQRWMKLIRPDDTFDYGPALIQFVLSNPLVDVALVGMRSPERVRQNVAIANDMAGRIDIKAVHRRS